MKLPCILFTFGTILFGCFVSKIHAECLEEILVCVLCIAVKLHPGLCSSILCALTVDELTYDNQVALRVVEGQNDDVFEYTKWINEGPALLY